jgi:hypothetical protein
MTTKKKTAKPATKPEAKSEGYKGHKIGSRKGQIHEIWDRDGDAAAMTKAKQLGLSPNTIKTWASAWRPVGGQR